MSQKRMIHTFYFFFLFHTWVHPSPIAQPQAVTAVVTPQQPPPLGCIGTFPGIFGIALINISLPSSSSESSSAAAGKLRARQQPPAPILTMGSIFQIGDGQVQGGMHTATITIVTPVAPVSQISDGQIQGPVVTDVPVVAMMEPQATASSLAPSSNVAVPVPFPLQVVNPSVVPSKPPTVLGQACSISTHRVPTPSPRASSPSPSSGLELSILPTQASSSNPASLNGGSTISAAASSSSSSFTSSLSGPIQSQTLSMVSCLTSSTLRLTLTNNSLYDAFNRTGYIASNYQFQFDGPPQSGAIYTSGWSICPVTNTISSSGAEGGGNIDNGGDGMRTLALGGTTTFWQCLSGDFYNLYIDNWAAQCSPVELRIVRLVECSGQT
ncbi:uncharacterized protein Z519_05450 [Cladophialophora bantiana CBS 173.52]|uniref:Cell wall mannoprotein PIR1-like C-terminal domain-containing protein n=1 Tax=Cladophialophora bantiana (strain ATCC 10958 / CBS 173.52 / CDC B-1940 / NIH 8579) TaxID=1442370 RepID=A0A0D2IBD2_CLAB1|nr:uncharacterized protein Z519_05450 [Cladophialophora bantiana CBS 173.52]KIW94134.1 hypothetical protein Z519_05450 [Cladophialophora bantiana CBS 173.52]